MLSQTGSHLPIAPPNAKSEADVFAKSIFSQWNDRSFGESAVLI